MFQTTNQTKYLTKGWPVEDIESQKIFGDLEMMILLAVTEKNHISTSVDP